MDANLSSGDTTASSTDSDVYVFGSVDDLNKPKLSNAERIFGIIVLCGSCASLLKRVISGESDKALSFCKYCELKKSLYPTFEYSTKPVHKLQM